MSPWTCWVLALIEVLRCLFYMLSTCNSDKGGVVSFWPKNKTRNMCFRNFGHALAPAPKNLLVFVHGFCFEKRSFLIFSWGTSHLGSSTSKATFDVGGVEFLSLMNHVVITRPYFYTNPEATDFNNTTSDFSCLVFCEYGRSGTQYDFLSKSFKRRFSSESYLNLTSDFHSYSEI